MAFRLAGVVVVADGLGSLSYRPRQDGGKQEGEMLEILTGSILKGLAYMYSGRNKGEVDGVATFHQGHQGHVFHVQCLQASFDRYPRAEKGGRAINTKS